MRSLTLAALVVLLAGCAEEGDLVLVQGPPAAEAPAAPPMRDAHAGCFPRTLALLAQADGQVARGAALDAESSLRDASRVFVTEDRVRTCPVDAHERVRARKLVLRGLAGRAAQADDLDVLLSLGDESLDAARCEPDLAPRCAEHVAWLRARFPNFVSGDEVRVTPLFRLPYTPQPGGRFTVEYMDLVQRRVDGLDGDVFALSLEPSGTAAVDAEPLGSLFELRVDGADVVETGADCAAAAATVRAGSVDVAAQGSACPKERKLGAHLTVRAPAADMLRAQGAKAVVVVISRKTLTHAGATWRASEARVAYGED